MRKRAQKMEEHTLHALCLSGWSRIQAVALYANTTEGSGNEAEPRM